MLFPRIYKYTFDEKQYFIDGMIWQNDKNLHLGEDDWDKIIAAVTPNNIEEFVEAFSSTVYNTRAPKAAEGKWGTLYESKAVRNVPPEYFYVQKASAKSLANQKVLTLAEAKTGMKKALEEISAFAIARKIDNWAKRFTDWINNQDPEMVKVLTPFFIPEAIEVLSMVQSRSAFGGMMSWNDLGLSDDNEYKKVSDSLFQTIQQAILSVAEYGTKT
jgi:hypothetical protein